MPKRAADTEAASDDPRRELLRLVGTTLGKQDPLAQSIVEVRAQRTALNSEKRVLTKQIRNTERKRRRMIEKSRRLSTMELVDVLNMRTQAENRKAAVASEGADPPPVLPDLPPLMEAPPGDAHANAALGGS